MASRVAVAPKLDVRVNSPRVQSKARMRIILAIGLAGVDLGILAGTTWLAQLLRSYSFAPFDPTVIVAVLLPIFILSAFAVRAYSATVLLNRWRAIVLVIAALGIACAAIALFLFAFKIGGIFSRLTLVLVFGASAILMTFARIVYCAYASPRLGTSVFSVVELRAGLATGRGIDTSRFFDPDRPNAISLNALSRVVGDADRVVLNCPPVQRHGWVKVLKGLGVRAEFVVNELADMELIGMGTYDGCPTVIVARGPLSLHDAAIKRGFDLAFASLALAVLSPLLIAVAVLIKLDGPGPVFFVQPRIGRRNTLFRIIKFRSMTQGKCDISGISSTCRDDPRVTRLGAFLRRSSIDELPQLINVLKGEMSIVGPRPHAINSTADDRLFWDVDTRYWLRHTCRPGLTGLAQIQGLRGATQCSSDLTDRIEADLAYLRSWSLVSDLRIILKTVQVLFGPKAY